MIVWQLLRLRTYFTQNIHDIHPVRGLPSYLWFLYRKTLFFVKHENTKNWDLLFRLFDQVHTRSNKSIWFNYRVYHMCTNIPIPGSGETRHRYSISPCRSKILLPQPFNVLVIICLKLGDIFIYGAFTLELVNLHSSVLFSAQKRV